MSERKNCVRCGRPIDRYARACPFCNWDQSEIPPPREEPPASQSSAPPTVDRWRVKILAAVAFVSLVIIAFVVGTLIHGFEPSEVKAASKNPPPASPASRSNVTFLPATSADLPQSIEQPITSAPPQAPGQQPNDATALPADQYATAAARANAQREAEKARNSAIDPRTLTGTAYEPWEKPVRRKEAPPGQNIVRTKPVAEEQPLPDISVDHEVTARLNLTISPEGRVTDVDIDQNIPDMPKLIAAIQRWRFKPATENGTPVAGHFSVEITFHGNE